MTALTDEEIAELLALAERATPGPWKPEQGSGWCWRLLYHGPSRYGKHWEGDEEWALLGQYDRANGAEQYSESDARFIASARTALPRALNELKAARERIAVLESADERAISEARAAAINDAIAVVRSLKVDCTREIVLIIELLEALKVRT